MNTRREVIRKLIRGTAVAGGGGLLWGTAITEIRAEDITLRPPGALEKDSFQKACLRCGQCVEACPYDTLLLARISDKRGIGTPHFEPRSIPCYMCTDYPCTEACPSGALDLKELSGEDNVPNINNARMGVAVIHRESCIAYWGIQCDACYRACPLMDSAITLEFESNVQTGKHANIKPVVNTDVCTGCGICEHACVVEKSAIHVLPGELAMGAVGKHYIKSWDEKDELRIIDKTEKSKDQDDDIESAIDYLNDSEGLFEE
ncbi:MAG: ferredoxin-type protein NapG [Bacteroidota bacterium]